MTETHPYKRTLKDRVISAFHAASYAWTEPGLLKRLRQEHAVEYSKTDSPLVSIMLPTFRRAALLEERTLPALRAQTYSNIEIIVVGDRRLDDTEVRIARMNDPRIRFCHFDEVSNLPSHPKRRWFVGGAAQRNYGLSLCRGTWIAETDDDDILTPDHVEALVRFAQAQDLEFVSAMYERERYGKRELVDVADVVPRVGGIETWLYRTYLREIPYNLDCWRKSYNCPQEIDRQLRMHHAGARMGFLEKSVALVLPLPGSQTVGLEALEIRTGQTLR